jgi:hypothetical protein
MSEDNAEVVEGVSKADFKFVQDWLNFVSHEPEIGAMTYNLDYSRSKCSVWIFS